MNLDGLNLIRIFAHRDCHELAGVPCAPNREHVPGLDCWCRPAIAFMHSTQE